MHISNEFGLNTNKIGLMMSSFFVSYSFTSLMGGYLANKFGSKIIVTTIIHIINN